MEMNIWFLICVGAISVSGQFLETEYRLDSVPLPIRRRINNAQYEIQPSIGREIEFSTEIARTSNQGRRHIENNHRGNIQNGQNPYENIYQTDDRNYEREPAIRRTNNNERQRENSENQFSGRLQEQHQENYARETNIQDIYRNNENQNQNHRTNDNTKLRTNLDNPQNNLKPNYPSNQNLRTSENSNQQNHRVFENSRQNGPQINTNTKTVDITSQNQDVQPNYASNDNVRINGNPIIQQTQNNRTNNNNEFVNNNRHTEASLRAIDSNNHGQLNVDSTNNNRNYNTKPSRQNTETTRDKSNINYESNRQTTEPTKRITIDDKSVTGGTKSTEDNELASRSHPDGRMGDNADDKWIWSSGGGKTTKTTIVPTNPTVDDRAAFSGDKCPTGQVRFNNMCVDVD